MGRPGGKGGGSSSAAPSKAAATPANTPTYVYMDTFNTKAVCRDDREAVRIACAPKSEATKAKDKAGNKGLISVVRRALEKANGLGQKIYGYQKGKPPGNEWMDDHCDGMWVKPQFTGADQYAEELQGLKDQLGKTQATLESYLQHPDKIVKAGYESLVREAREQLGPEAVENLAYRHLANTAAGGLSPVGGRGKLVMVLARLAKLGYSASSAYDAMNTVANALNTLDAKAQMRAIDFMLNDAQQRLGDVLKVWQERPDVAMAELMSLQGELDPCLRARKCMLVPYESNAKRPLKPSRNKNYVDDGKGCCPGQTGHHVIPDAAVKNAGCEGYKYKEAPTICLEGQDNTYGSHGRAHKELTKSITNYRLKHGDKISYTEMRNRALEAIKNSTQQCKPECLQAQLDDYYKNCKELDANSGSSSQSKGGTECDHAHGSDAE